MVEEARGWYLSQRMFQKIEGDAEVLSRNRCSAFHSEAGVQEHTSGEGNAQDRWQLMPALNLSSALAIAILLEPASLSNKAVPSRRGYRSRRFETRCRSGNELCPIGIYLPQAPTRFKVLSN